MLCDIQYIIMCNDQIYRYSHQPTHLSFLLRTFKVLSTVVLKHIIIVVNHSCLAKTQCDRPGIVFSMASGQPELTGLEPHQSLGHTSLCSCQQGPCAKTLSTSNVGTVTWKPVTLESSIHTWPSAKEGETSDPHTLGGEDANTCSFAPDWEPVTIQTNNATCVRVGEPMSVVGLLARAWVTQRH